MGTATKDKIEATSILKLAELKQLIKVQSIQKIVQKFVQKYVSNVQKVHKVHNVKEV